jgi:hypothetical protein
MPLNDYDNQDRQIDLTEIAPFSFFAVFNRPIKDEKRRAILAALKGEWGLRISGPFLVAAQGRRTSGHLHFKKRPRRLNDAPGSDQRALQAR